jgi:hypothetical protein
MASFRDASSARSAEAVHMHTIPLLLRRSVAALGASALLTLGGLPAAAQPAPELIYCDRVDPHCLRVNDAVVVEGNSGTRYAVFSIDLIRSSTEQILVDVETSDGSAGSAYQPGPNHDFVDSGSVVVFSPGETRETFSVPVHGDTLLEANEIFYLDVVQVVGSGVYVMDGRGQATITNDDLPSVRVSDASVTEGLDGVRQLQFSVSLSGRPTQAVSVGYATAPNTATAGVDYGTRANTLQFAANTSVLSQTVNVPVYGDLLDEAHETLFLNLNPVTGATLADGQGVGTIVDDDPLQPPCPSCEVP